MLYTIIITIIIIIALSVLVYYKTIKPSKYWQEKDVTHVKSWPVVGSMADFAFKKKHIFDIAMDIYRKFPDERCVGYMQFTQPFLMIRDLDLIKQICVKDFDYFHDHLAFNNIKNDPILSKGLVSLGGNQWKQMRATLSPAFTSSKMRNMHKLIVDCAKTFVEHFQRTNERTIEMKEAISRFSNDVIASTAFGIKIDSLEEPNNDFFTLGSKFTKIDFAQTLKMFMLQLAPSVSNFLRIQMFAEDVYNFFRSIVKDNMSKRQAEGISRPDLIQLLMEARAGRLKHESSKEEKAEGFAVVEESHIGKHGPQMELTDDHIVAQAITFFFAGLETVSTASSFMAHELAVNPDVQKRLQIEIDAVSQEHQGDPPYEALLSMKYLDQVVCETLRLWPPVFQTDRLCVKNYVIEPKNPREKVVFVEKGVAIMVPIVALHRDSQYFPEPDRFDPERFNEDNRAKIIPGSYLPFGVGPRNCIGSRFALLEMKALFFHLLSKFIIVPVEETEIPPKISPKKLSLAPENGFKLRLQLRSTSSH